MAAYITSGARAPGLAAPELAARPAADLPSVGAPGAAAAGLTAHHKDEARELGGGAGFRGQGTADDADSPGAVPDEQGDGKRFATLRARLALRGWALTRTNPAGGPVLFFASRWDMPRELQSLEAVASFADRVGAPQ